MYAVVEQSKRGFNCGRISGNYQGCGIAGSLGVQAYVGMFLVVGDRGFGMVHWKIAIPAFGLNVGYLVDSREGCKSLKRLAHPARLERAACGFEVLNAAGSICKCLIYKAHKNSIHQTEGYKTIQNETSIAQVIAKDNMQFPIFSASASVTFGLSHFVLDRQLRWC
ncbi:MAG TPA: hypothetical protein VE398_25375 [Acidobacteriota bacterium]|nr:hypothetical protein [Acidobacteriota bacterium]